MPPVPVTASVTLSAVENPGEGPTPHTIAAQLLASTLRLGFLDELGAGPHDIALNGVTNAGAQLLFISVDKLTTDGQPASSVTVLWTTTSSGSSSPSSNKLKPGGWICLASPGTDDGPASLTVHLESTLPPPRATVRVYYAMGSPP